MMTFTHTHEDTRGNIVDSIQCILYEDEGIHGIMQTFRRFLLAVSFQPETVDQYIEAV